MAVLELILNTGQIIHVPLTPATVVTVDNGAGEPRASVTDVASVASLGSDVPAKTQAAEIEKVEAIHAAAAPKPAAKKTKKAAAKPKGKAKK